MTAWGRLRSHPTMVLTASRSTIIAGDLKRSRESDPVPSSTSQDDRRTDFLRVSQMSRSSTLGRSCALVIATIISEDTSPFILLMSGNTREMRPSDSHQSVLQERRSPARDCPRPGSIALTRSGRCDWRRSTALSQRGRHKNLARAGRCPSRPGCRGQSGSLDIGL
jgi:hypothetical protein